MYMHIYRYRWYSNITYYKEIIVNNVIYICTAAYLYNVLLAQNIDIVCYIKLLYHIIVLLN